MLAAQPNPFDQFDQTDAPSPAVAPAPPPADPARIPATPVAEAAPTNANPFDQFDHADAPPPAQLHHYQVKTPSGHTFEFTAPADATPEQLDAMSRKAAGYGDKYPVAAQSAPSVGGQLLANTENDVAGIAQGAAQLPDMAAEGVGKILSAIPNAISEAVRAAGHHGAADWIQNNITHNLANPLQIGHAIEEVAPTPDTTSGKVNRFVGQLVGSTAAFPTATAESVVSKLVGDAPKAVVAAKAAAPAAEAAPDYVQLARDLKIRRTPATNSKSGVATGVQGALATLPGSDSMIMAAKAREADDLATAAKGVAASVGDVSSRQAAGDAVAQGAQEYKQASGLEGNGMYGQRDALIGGPGTPVPTDNAKAALDDIASRFPTSPAIAQLREHPAIRAIGGALPGEPTVENVPTGLLDGSGNPITRPVTSGGGPLALGEVTEALSHVRGVVRNLESQTMNGKATAPVLARAKQVEQGLEDDVMAAAQKADLAAGRAPGSEGSAVKAQRDADAFWADRASALNGALKKPLKSATDDTQMSGGAVYNQIAGDMDAKSGNLARLRDAWFRLPDQAKSTFAATKIDDLGRAMPGQQNDAGTAWSFQSFLTNLNKMSPQARNIVFGPKADTQLQQIATYADRLRQLDKTRNFSNTAQKAFSAVYMGGVVGSLMHGDISGAVEVGATAPAFAGVSKLLLSSPAMRDWTAQAMRATISGNEVGLRVLTRKLGTIAAAQPAYQSQIIGLQRSIQQVANDNLHSAAASGSQQNPDSEGKKAQGPR